MRRFIPAIMAVASFLGTAVVAPADDGLPTVTVTLASTGELENDLKFMTSLAGKRGAQQWPVIQNIMQNAFFMGIDPSLPVRMDVLLTEPRDYRICLPFSGGKDDDLIKNIELFVGGKPRRFGAGLQVIKAAGFNGYIRTLKKPAYCLLAQDRNNIPAAFDPLADIQPLLAIGYDVAARVANTPGAAGADERRAAIGRLRQELLDALAKLPGETDTELELRRVSLIHNLWELERLFADSEQLTLGWTTDVDKHEARLELELFPLKGTDLEKSIAELAVKPSLFSKAARTDNSIFFGRINHTLDATRQKNIAEILDLLEKRTAEQVDTSEEIAKEHRDGVKKAVVHTFQILRDGVKMGVVDGFANVSLIDGKRSFVAAIRTPEGAATVEVLKSVAEAGLDVEVAKTIEGDVAYHMIKLPQSKTADFSLLFGTNELHVATSPTAVYYAAGAGAEEQLKAAVAETGEDEALNDGTFAEGWYKLGPWIEVLKERREKREAGLDLTSLTDVEKKARETSIKLRDDAIAAFADGKDTIHTRLQRKDEKVIGLTTIAESCLKFVGEQIVRIAAEKL